MSTPVGPAASGVCAACDATLEPGAAFCGSCGARVVAAGAEGGPVAPLTRAEPPAPGPRPAPAAWSLGVDVDDAVAPVWRRLLALLVDQALAVLVGGAGLLAVLPTLRAERTDGSVGALLVPGLLLLLLAAGQWFAEAFGGRTVGGALLGTRTVSARTGRAPGLWAVLVRSVVQSLGVLLAGVGVYVVAGSGAWDEGPEQRGWHDKAAGTLVLRARAPRREDPAPARVAPARVAPAPVAPDARSATPTSGPPRSAAATAPEASAPAPPRVTPTSGPPAPPVATSVLPADRPAGGERDSAARPDVSGPAAPVPPAPTSASSVPASSVPLARVSGEPLPELAEPPAAPASSALDTPVPPTADTTLQPSAPAPPPAPPTTAPTAPRHAASGALPDAPGSASGRTAPVPTEPAATPAATATSASPTPTSGTPSPATPPETATDAPFDLADTTVPTAGLGDLEHTRVGRWAGSLDAASSTLALVLDTGERVVVTGPGLVGRRPVPGAEQWAHLVTIDDPGQSVSSTHLAFWPVDGGLDVLDRGSTNGTVLLDAAGKPWSLPPGQPARVGAGWTLVLGSRRITVTRT